MEQRSKPFLGGYRDKKTGCLYHNATCQTDTQSKPEAKPRKADRDTQTVFARPRATQTVREAGVQMARPDLLLDTIHDRILYAGAYTTSETVAVSREKAAVVVQSHLRGLFARRRVAGLQKSANAQRVLRDLAESTARQDAEDERAREIERRIRPRTAADFALLNRELDVWVAQETKKIKDACLSEAQEHAALQALVIKHAKLLQTIDRLRTIARRHHKHAAVAGRLRAMSAPKVWELRNGRSVELHTQFTMRAKELMRLYYNLELPVLTTDERLEVLLQVKWTVKEFECNLTREIVRLIDREADLLNRGRSPVVLDGLRRRILGLFLEFIETPEFNPEASAFTIHPVHPDRDFVYNLGEDFVSSYGTGLQSGSLAPQGQMQQAVSAY